MVPELARARGTAGPREHCRTRLARAQVEAESGKPNAPLLHLLEKTLKGLTTPRGEASTTVTSRLVTGGDRKSVV